MDTQRQPPATLDTLTRAPAIITGGLTEYPKKSTALRRTTWVVVLRSFSSKRAGAASPADPQQKLLPVPLCARRGSRCPPGPPRAVRPRRRWRSPLPRPGCVEKFFGDVLDQRLFGFVCCLLLRSGVPAFVAGGRDDGGRFGVVLAADILVTGGRQAERRTFLVAERTISHRNEHKSSHTTHDTKHNYNSLYLGISIWRASNKAQHLPRGHKTHLIVVVVVRVELQLLQYPQLLAESLYLRHRGPRR